MPADDRQTGSSPWLLDALARTIWLSRPDLRDLCGRDADRFAGWLLITGTSEYQALTEAVPQAPPGLLGDPAPEALPGVAPTLTRFMKQVWALRPDVQAVFDLRTPAGQHGFVWWYFLHGVGELKLGGLVTEDQRRFLHDPDPRVVQDAVIPVSRLMVALWERSPELRAALPLAVPEGRAGLLQWFFTRGVAAPGLPALIDRRYADTLLAPHPADRRLPRLLAVIWSADPDLRTRFPDPGGGDFLGWAAGPGRSALPVLDRLAAVTGPAARPSHARRAGSLPFGVNLIGHARGQFGIGEDVRMAALALQAAGIPFVIHNVDPGPEVCQGDDSAAGLISHRLPYALNMLCTTGFEAARLAALEGTRLFDGRPTIGFWPWELPVWPAVWQHAFDIVDEVWAASRFTYEAYAASCPKPVRHMPMAVSVDAAAGLRRRDFGLPEGRFLFLFAFDLLSSLARKNPHACLRAFREAFPAGDEPVGLVVKVMRPAVDNPVWRALLAEARADARIAVIDRTLGRGELLDLFRACDCFVSLHRAEGFGRGMAEAMMLGKPVIATGYSGNLDFTTPGTAALVEHRPRIVGENEYPFGTGQRWAEPDPSHAAWWMRRLVREPQTAQRLATLGCRITRETYAPAVVGASYAALWREGRGVTAQPGPDGQPIGRQGPWR